MDICGWIFWFTHVKLSLGYRSRCAISVAEVQLYSVVGGIAKECSKYLSQFILQLTEHETSSWICHLGLYRKMLLIPDLSQRMRVAKKISPKTEKHLLCL